MQHGDFTKLAKEYKNRPGYSKDILKMIGRAIGWEQRNFFVADVGAGTGKLTEELSFLGLKGYAVEPNDAMRAEGIKNFENQPNFKWIKGFAEDTGLPDESVDWVLMGSSFHWTDNKVALKEFRRILKPGGYFTAIWNPRDMSGGDENLNVRVEKMIEEKLPNMKRVSSGGKEYNSDIEAKILSTPYFGHLVFTEAAHTVTMSKERYLGVWRSVNDIQVQAGEKLFAEIMKKIEEIIAPYEEIVVPYKSRAWTVQAL